MKPESRPRGIRPHKMKEIHFWLVRVKNFYSWDDNLTARLWADPEINADKPG